VIEVMMMTGSEYGRRWRRRQGYPWQTSRISVYYAVRMSRGAENVSHSA